MLEMLVVTFVLALLFVMLAEGVNLGMHGWVRQDRAAEGIMLRQDVELALRRLMRQAEASEAVAPGISAGFVGQADRMVFHAVVRLGDGQRHAVIMGVALDRAHRLVLRWRIAPPAGCAPKVARRPVHEEILAEGIGAVQWRYWAGRPHPVWQTGWQGSAPPLLLGVTVVSLGGRAWTEIVIHPQAAEAADAL